MRIVGYTDPLTAAPDELVRVMVSSESETYRARLVRLVHGDINAAGPGFKADAVAASFAGQYRGRRQALRTGSWAEIPDHPVVSTLRSFTVSFWTYPTLVGTRQALISKHSDEHGLLLSIDERGLVVLELCSRGAAIRLVTPRPVPLRAWTFVTASYDHVRCMASLSAAPRDWCDGEPQVVQGSGQLPALLDNGSPLIVAARSREGSRELEDHFNGKIGCLRLFDRPIDREAALGYQGHARLR